ncbi:eosinophil cationic protein-like isoform X2 [Arvicanthis niloticus]|uniref:eosinophil cationic protein-like isoform X2 n=2 Tax=Arvicanthis niloticus TaxID=61156 RepID=UPI00402BD8F6
MCLCVSVFMCMNMPTDAIRRHQMPWNGVQAVDNQCSVPQELQLRLGNMGLKMLESRLCLLLLLGLVLLLASCQPPTPSQWFAIQHIYNSAYRQCNPAMLMVNSYKKRCKNINTFLNTTFADVVHVCGNPNGTCKNQRATNCHNSTSQVPIMFCNLTFPSRNYTLCRYQTTRAVKFYTVACDNRTAQDSPIYPVVPVHLDGTF